MKKFILYLFSLLLGLTIILYLLDLTYTYVFTHGTPRNKISYLLSLKNQRISYVFLGSSRVDNTIDSEVIESRTGKRALNLGVQGGKLDDSFLMLQLLHRQGITSDTVFIQVDYIFNMEGNSEILKSNLMPHINQAPISNFIRERSSDYYYLRYLPFYRYLKYDYKIGFREFVSTLLGKKPNHNLENGYRPKYGQANQKLIGKLPAKIKNSNKTIGAINRYASQHNINIVYFMAPFCSNTINLDYGAKLTKKIPGFLDFSTVFEDHDEYFFNCGHLNDKGAKEFSQLLADVIEGK